MAEDGELLELVLTVQNASTGEREAVFDELDREARPTALRFFRGKGFLPEEVEDLTQEAMLRVFHGIEAFRRDSPFNTWLFEILLNVYRNEIRRRRSAKRFGKEVSIDMVPSADSEERAFPSVPVLVVSDLDPLAALLRREGKKRFREALQELPRQMRRVCQLRYVQGRKYREIAELLGLSIETVKAHLHQAKKRLEGDLRVDSDPLAPPPHKLGPP